MLLWNPVHRGDKREGCGLHLTNEATSNDGHEDYCDWVSSLETNIRRRDEESQETYCISVKRICQGGNPWSSKGFWLYFEGTIECRIIRSGDGKPCFPNKNGLRQWRQRCRVRPKDLAGLNQELWQGGENCRYSFLCCVYVWGIGRTS